MFQGSFQGHPKTALESRTIQMWQIFHKDKTFSELGSSEVKARIWKPHHSSFLQE